MVLLLVLVVSLAAGSGAFSAIRHWPQADPASTATEASGPIWEPSSDLGGSSVRG